MRGVELHIAWRYLFSPKSHHAINIVSGVSAAAVGVVTAAMICVLSVMNGFSGVVESMFSQLDPELRITASSGKYFDTTAPQIQSLRSLSSIAVYSECIEETALIEFESRQIPATLKGVDTAYASLTHIDDIILDGKYQVWDGAFERSVLGVGLANQLSIGAHFVRGLHLYAPRRQQAVNLMRPDESFNDESCFIAGIFAVNQVQYDDHYMLVSLPLARRLFDYNDHQVTAIELRLQPQASVPAVQREICQMLGADYQVLNRYEQQADFFRIVKVEKLMVTLLLVFILLIATFNIIGSLTMLMIDKQHDISILQYLGASSQQIQHIFRYEGWLISSLGALTGLVCGLALSLAQEHWGLLKLGNGTEYVLTAYPVEVEALDIVFVLAVVLIIGWIAAYIPTKTLRYHESLHA